MQNYEVRISRGAKADMTELRKFLKAMMTEEGAVRYANAATDIEFKMPFGFKEVEGIHSRTNFDLSQHEKYSGKSIKYFDPQTNGHYGG